MKIVTLLKDVNKFLPITYIFLVGFRCVKFGTYMRSPCDLLNNSGVRKNRRSESHTLLTQAPEFLSTVSASITSFACDRFRADRRMERRTFLISLNKNTFTSAAWNRTPL